MSRGAAEAEALLRSIIEAWPHLDALPTYARRMHGYGDSDGGFGIAYPGDLDEYARAVEGECIPAGMVEAYARWGPPEGDGLLVAETTYLRVLAEVLREHGRPDESAAIEAFAASRG